MGKTHKYFRELRWKLMVIEWRKLAKFNVVMASHLIFMSYEILRIKPSCIINL
jgi:hypothetical protein